MGAFPTAAASLSRATNSVVMLFRASESKKACFYEDAKVRAHGKSASWARVFGSLHFLKDLRRFIIDIRSSSCEGGDG